MVINEIIKAVAMATKNTIYPISTWWANCCNHSFIAYQANGQANNPAIITHLTNSFYMSMRILAIEEPRAFRIPISFVLPSIIKEDNPNNPIAEINIARNVE